MLGKLANWAWVAGELSPNLHFRGDLEKYDFGLAEARNFFINYEGGASTRAGTEFIDYLENDDKLFRLIEFKFSPDIANTYLIVMGDGYFRFVQDGAYVLEADKTISGATAADPCVVTATAHGFSNGDWIKIASVGGMTELNNRTFEVASVTTDTFALKNPDGTNLDASGYTAYTSGGTTSRIYTVTHTYANNDFSRIQFKQFGNSVRITHDDDTYGIKILTRTDATDWTLSDVDLQNSVTVPTNLGLVATSGDLNSTVAMTVTAVVDGQESLHAIPITALVRDYVRLTAGGVRATWDQVTGAEYYKVYRTVLGNDNEKFSLDQPLGFLGRTFGTSFLDSGEVLPDFKIGPPIQNNPFIGGKIEYIQMTAGGTLYNREDATVSVSDSGGTGSGFVGFPIIQGTSSEIEGVVIIDHGKNYTGTITVTFAGTTGSGATATATLSSSSNYTPAVSETFQQRQIYAATKTNPLTVYGSKIRLFDDFGVSASDITDDDAYEFTIDDKTIAPIRHMLAIRGGLLIFAHTTVWQLVGTNGGAVTPTDALAEPQSYLGCGILPPLTIDTDVLYIQAKKPTVRLLSYNDFSKLYAGRDMSILSSHFFQFNNRLSEWTYAESPNKLVWCVRADGRLLSFTIDKEQDVYAWMQHSTNGRWKNVQSVEEDNIDRVYAIVERKLGGAYRQFLERMHVREQEYVEDSVALDCSLSLGQTYPTGTITASVKTGEGVTFTVTGGTPFSSGNVNDILRLGGGKAKITGFTSSTVVTGTWLRDQADVNTETDEPFPISSGDWTMDTPVTVISGLWHREGETVDVLVDGNVQASKTVADGQITIDNAGTIVHLGHKFLAYGKTLPFVAADKIIQDVQKRPVGVAVRVKDTVGLKVGDSLTNVEAAAERRLEIPGEPIELTSKLHRYIATSHFNEDGQMYFVQDEPLPATVLGQIVELEFEDED